MDISYKKQWYLIIRLVSNYNKAANK